MTVLGLLLAVLVICIVVWVTKSLLAAFSVGDPLRTVVILVVVLLCLWLFLGQAGLVSPIPLQ